MQSIKEVSIQSRVIQVAEPGETYNVTIDSPGSVSDLVRRLIGNVDEECFLAFYLNIRNKIMGFRSLTAGSPDACPVDVRGLFRPALVLGSSALMVAHNHPSGDPQPSINDMKLTERIVEAGNILGVPLLDHIIVGDGRSYSFRAHGRM